MDIEERLQRLEDFIGNIDRIRLYANSLQEVLDRYIQPLYIEQGTDNIMLINDYLGDLENIPHNVIFKIRTSHDLVITEGAEAIIRFERGTEFKEYPLRKISDKLLVALESDNYTDGSVYDVYINSQDIAIITSNDVGIRALSEVTALSTALNEAVTSLNNTINTNYTTLDGKINSTATTAQEYTDRKAEEAKGNTDSINNFLSGISKDGDNYTFKGNVVAASIEAPSLKVTSTVDLAGVSGFLLPSGTTISDPSSNLGLANKQWAETYVKNYVDTHFEEYHFTGTIDAPTALSAKPNGAFYYKLEQ